MKFLLLSIALLLTAQIAFSQDWAPVEDTFGDELVQSLKFVGSKYILQKGIFESSKTPIPEGFWFEFETESIESRTIGDVTYYRFSVILEVIKFHQNRIRARYTVSHRPSNGRIRITAWSYSKLRSGEDVDEYDSTGYWDYQDARDNYPILQNAVSTAVAKAIQDGELPDSSYSIQFVYSAWKYEVERDKYIFILTLRNSAGNYYLVRLASDGTDDNTFLRLHPSFEDDPVPSID